MYGEKRLKRHNRKANRSLFKKKNPHYSRWYGMMDRCYNPACLQYANYGGRGIKVCDEWHDYKVFKEWADKTYIGAGTSLDRTDNNGDYSPDNCQWADAYQQADNRRNTIRFEIGEQTMSISECARAMDVPYNEVYFAFKSLPFEDFAEYVKIGLNPCLKQTTFSWF